MEMELRWFVKSDGSKVLQKSERLSSNTSRWVDVPVEYGVVALEEEESDINHYPPVACINDVYVKELCEFILHSIAGHHSKSYEFWEQKFNNR